MSKMTCEMTALVCGAGAGIVSPASADGIGARKRSIGVGISSDYWSLLLFFFCNIIGLRCSARLQSPGSSRRRMAFARGVTRKRSIGVGFSSDVWSSLFFICHMW